MEGVFPRIKMKSMRLTPPPSFSRGICLVLCAPRAGRGSSPAQIKTKQSKIVVIAQAIKHEIDSVGAQPQSPLCRPWDAAAMQPHHTSVKTNKNGPQRAAPCQNGVLLPQDSRATALGVKSPRLRVILWFHNGKTTLFPPPKQINICANLFLTFTSNKD